MKSFGGIATKNKLKQECEQYVAEHLDEIRYELFAEIVQDNFRQAEAMFLYALSLHGFGEQRLQRIHKWFKDLTEWRDFDGKPFTCTDCMEHMRKKYGIDFDSVNVKFESKEHYDRR